MLLPRLLTGDAVHAAALLELGDGGLLVENAAFRLPPYRPDSLRGIVG